MNKINKKKLIFDIVLIASLLLVAVSSFFIIEAFKEKGEYAVVEYNGKEIARYPLSVDGEFVIQPEKSHTPEGEPILNGGTNLLVIKDGCAYIKSADCPDKLCVNFGKISRTGERITCLPNRISVVIRGNGEDILISQ